MGPNLRGMSELWDGGDRLWGLPQRLLHHCGVVLTPPPTPAQCSPCRDQALSRLSFPSPGRQEHHEQVCPILGILTMGGGGLPERSKRDPRAVGHHPPPRTLTRKMKWSCQEEPWQLSNARR